MLVYQTCLYAMLLGNNLGVPIPVIQMSVLYWLQSLFPKHIFNQQLLVYANQDTSGVDIVDDEQLEEPVDEPLVDDYESNHLIFFNEKAHISVQSEELKAENKLHKFSTTNSIVESCQSGETTLVFEPKHKTITVNSQPVKAKTKNIKADQEETPSTIKIKETDIRIIRVSSKESTQGTLPSPESALALNDNNHHLFPKSSRKKSIKRLHEAIKISAKLTRSLLNKLSSTELLPGSHKLKLFRRSRN